MYVESQLHDDGLLVRVMTMIVVVVGNGQKAQTAWKTKNKSEVLMPQTKPATC